LIKKLKRKFLGLYTIEQIQPQPNGTPSKIKVKVRLNRSGIFDIPQASIIEPSDESTGEKFPKKSFKSKDFPIEESMDTRVKTEDSTEQNLPTTSDSMEEVSSIVLFVTIKFILFFEG
jgi:hypothetical protein